MTIKNRYKKIEMADIPDHNYSGYVWYSDAEKPIIIETKEPFHLDMLTELPFIIEGHLFCESEQISIQIKNIDGQYHFAEIDINGLLDQAKNYVGHDLNTDYKMVEAWEEYPDPLCTGMMTLRPAWRAFAGFTNIHTENI